MARVKTNIVTEFGDFQTPPSLAASACALLQELGVKAVSIVEPTCGRGAFLFAAADRWHSASVVQGLDINAAHLDSAEGIAKGRSDAQRFSLECADFFRIDWSKRVAQLPQPVLIVGNPPWVTNSGVSALGGSNVPRKSNFQGYEGLGAITGKANFDISEWMLIKLAEAVRGRDAVIGMLVKTAVARKILSYCWKNGLSLLEANLFCIDAAVHFSAAVHASLIVLRFGPNGGSKRAQVFGQLSQAIGPLVTIGLADELVVADLEAYDKTKHLRGHSILKWRSGIKHDCSKVMELRYDGKRFSNGLGEMVDVEAEYLYPMRKSSEVASGTLGKCTRWMIVPQRRVGQSTAEIAELAPKTWRYLQSHRDFFSKRGSSIYRGKPDFSVFGIGGYTFSPWKIAISGMYKRLGFVKVGPCSNKPVVFDDTTNFLPCPSDEGAALMLRMLETAAARDFYRAYIFWDAKRPITIDLLGRLNLHALASELDVLGEFETHFGPDSRAAGNREPLAEAPTFW